MNAITPEKLYESTLPLAFKVTSVSLESPQDTQLAVALYGSNGSYSVGSLLTTVCTQWAHVRVYSRFMHFTHSLSSEW